VQGAKIHAPNLKFLLYPRYSVFIRGIPRSKKSAADSERFSK